VAGDTVELTYRGLLFSSSTQHFRITSNVHGHKTRLNPTDTKFIDDNLKALLTQEVAVI
jgi:hypothetical protein